MQNSLGSPADEYLEVERVEKEVLDHIFVDIHGIQRPLTDIWMSCHRKFNEARNKRQIGVFVERKIFTLFELQFGRLCVILPLPNHFAGQGSMFLSIYAQSLMFSAAFGLTLKALRVSSF